MSRLLAVDIPSTFFGSHTNAGVATSDVGKLISTILPNIIVLAGVIFFFLILFGGFGMIIGAGHNASPQEAAKAKAALTYGLVGFLLVVSAYFILQMISTATGVPFFSYNNLN